MTRLGIIFRMKLVSWNVNGIRACVKKGCWQWFEDYQPDICCIQETKANLEDIPSQVKDAKGYFSYFDHAKEKKGYSGVGVFSKIEPEEVKFGMGIPELDQEGRYLALYFPEFVLINIYFPNGGGGPIRLTYKLKFYEAFLKHVETLRK